MKPQESKPNAVALPAKGDALVLVDVQNDFMPRGALAVPLADLIIAPLNRCIRAFEARGLPVFATRDWHPANHCSFLAQGGQWPPHCVAGTQGAGFASDLYLPNSVCVISKGTHADSEAWSGFQGTELETQLRQLGCTRVVLAGLATDYCILATALDARSAGFEVVVLENAIRGVNRKPGDTQAALSKMVAAGVKLGSAPNGSRRSVSAT